LEKQVDDAHFKTRSIDRQEYIEHSKEIQQAWKDLGQSYNQELINKSAPTGKSVAKEVGVDPELIHGKSQIADKDHKMDAQTKANIDTVNKAMKDGAQAVYSRMSTTIGKRVGPVESITMVRNDHPALAGKEGALNNVCAYDSKEKRVYISSACSTKEEIQHATAFAVTQHVYENGPKEVRDKLNDSFQARADVKGGLKTEKYGENAPYFEGKGKGFWTSYQGVVPLSDEGSGLLRPDINRGGMHMATVAFSTVTSPNEEKLGSIMRDPEKRKTLFDSMKPFSVTAKKGGKVRE